MPIENHANSAQKNLVFAVEIHDTEPKRKHSQGGGIYASPGSCHYPHVP